MAMGKRKRIGGTVSVSVDVDVDVDVKDVLDQLDEDELRGYLGITNDTPDTKDVIRDVIAMLRRGETCDAIVMLERQFLPKWESTQGCESAYRQAVAASHQAPS